MVDTASDSKLLITDDLHTLKEGEIFTDPESGKKYRVRKTILPGRSSQGPHGIGDPDDRSLRKIEADVIIPRRMNDRIEQVDCRPFYLALVQCLRSEGCAVGMKSCKSVLHEFNRCKWDKFHDTAFREQVTDAYLAERSEARRTGMTEKQRKLEEYRNWKKMQNADTH